MPTWSNTRPRLPAADASGWAPVVIQRQLGLSNPPDHLVYLLLAGPLSGRRRRGVEQPVDKQPQAEREARLLRAARELRHQACEVGERIERHARELRADQLLGVLLGRALGDVDARLVRRRADIEESD